ncbi:hypothetical protein DFR30_1173 [Thiogranum longum]|uniref:PEGA domain-containing protein n=1 Tax=Thiogranum longum TaxID=1537524 RepID=A0A4R1HEY1_9GAMM|nr:hypothetical protein [Thiogranum longum]TCK17919.1 hypothetical protein DFR30_1173 [Thiogranum longum]
MPKIIFILCFSVLITGCATLFSPSSDTVSFESEQSGIEAFVEGKKVGEVPFSIDLDREVFKHKFITFKKPGYKTMQMRVKKSLNKTSLFNLTSWPSWLTDAMSGNMMEYSPGHYIIELEPKEPATQSQQDAILKRFVWSQFINIRRDVARGHGDYRDTLDKLAQENFQRLPAWSNQALALAVTSSQNPAQLYRRVTEWLRNPQPSL